MTISKIRRVPAFMEIYIFNHIFRVKGQLTLQANTTTHRLHISKSHVRGESNYIETGRTMRDYNYCEQCIDIKSHIL